MNAVGVAGALQEGKPACRIASAVYPLCSMLNHSCVPNVDVRFEGGVAKVFALGCLDGGDELALSYVPLFGKHDSQTRRAMLLEGY